MMFGGHLLSLLIWLPVIGGFIVLTLNGRVALAKWLSLGISCAALLLSVPLYASFKTGTAAMQFVERSPWISTLHSEFYIGVDGISMPGTTIGACAVANLQNSSYKGLAATSPARFQYRVRSAPWALPALSPVPSPTRAGSRFSWSATM